MHMTVLFWRWAVKGRVWDLSGDGAIPGRRWVWFTCLDVWSSDGRLSSACLSDHLAERYVLVLEQHVCLIVLRDSAVIQDLQSHTHSDGRVCRHLYTLLSENLYFSCFSAEWCIRTAQSERGNSRSLHLQTIHFMWLTPTANTRACFCSTGHTDNEHRLLTVWESSTLTLTDRRSGIYPCIYPGVSLAQGWSSVKANNHTLFHTLENYHHFSVIACHVQTTQKNSANSSSLEKTEIISQTNSNKHNLLTVVTSSLLQLKPSFGDCLV